MKNCNNCGITADQAHEQGLDLYKPDLQPRNGEQHLCTNCMELIHGPIKTEEVIVEPAKSTARAVTPKAVAKKIAKKVVSKKSARSKKTAKKKSASRR